MNKYHQKKTPHTLLWQRTLSSYVDHTGTGLRLCLPERDHSSKSYPGDSATRMLAYTRNFCQEASSGTTVFFFFFPIWHLLASWGGAILKLKYYRNCFCHFSVHICLLSNEAYSRWHHLYKITKSDPAYCIPMQLTLTFLSYGELNNVATGSDTYI